MFQHSPIAESDIYHLLSNSRRRETLTVLLYRPEEMTLRELSERIAATEAGVSPAPRPLRDSVYNALHQTHLPKLDALGFINYNPDRKLVRPCKQTRQINRYMDTVTRFGVTWGEYYRALGIAGLFTVVASLADVPVFAVMDPLVIASASLALFALSTSYQLVTDSRWVFSSLRARLRSYLS